MAGRKALNYPARLRMVLFSPGRFFKAVRGEKGFREPFIFLLITAIIASVLDAIVFASGITPFSIIPGFAQIFGTAFVILGFLGALISPFVWAAVYHVFVWILKGRGGYEDTYKAVAYSSAASIFSFLMYASLANIWLFLLISIAFGIWGLIILTIGLSVVHKISRGRAVLIWLLPVLILVALAVIFILGIFSLALAGAGAFRV